MIYLRQSTASQEVPLGHFLDATDGDTAETGLTIANTDIKVWKAGATSLANKNSGGATHMAGGVYYAVLDATDSDTVGALTLFVHVAGALAVKVDCCVLEEAVFDELFAASAPGIAAMVVEGSYTLKMMVRLFAAALLGKASGLATATAVFRDTGDSKDRISATVDANGNRSAVTLDAS